MVVDVQVGCDISLLQIFEHSLKLLELHVPRLNDAAPIAPAFGLDPLTAVVRGEVFLEGDIYLRVREVLDFDSGFLQTYSYEVYRGDEQLYWYDDWSHPDIPELTNTDPHHKHIPPDLKHHRVPAPHLSFDRPNLPFLIKEIEQMLLSI